MTRVGRRGLAFFRPGRKELGYAKVALGRGGQEIVLCILGKDCVSR